MSSPFDPPRRGSARIPGVTPPRARAAATPPVRGGARVNRPQRAGEPGEARRTFQRDPRRARTRPEAGAGAEGAIPRGPRRPATRPGEPEKQKPGKSLPLTDKKGNPLTPEQAKKLVKKRKRRKIYLITCLTILVLIFAGMGAGYAALQVPLPNLNAAAQVSVIYYSDGKTQLARLGAENREEVKLREVPKHVQRAVVAAEDRSFYENSGISVKGMLRAFWSNLKGNDTQGASTITQQYVKNAYLSQERTLSRKTKEIILARKMDKEYSKSQILEFYLNTIFWGRNAYGIQAASKAYFGVTVDKLTPEQGALLAGIIKSPNALDPETNPEGAKGRWEYVMKGMVEEGWINKAQAQSAQMPTVIPKTQARTNSGLKGATGTIMTRVQSELIKSGISEQQLNTAGLRITTTIDPKMQQELTKAVSKNMQGQPAGLATAVAAVEPGTGKVKAYYGGEAGFESFDLAGPKAPHPPGSSFKAYVLAKALEEGISVESLWDASSPRTFPDREKPIRNAGNDNSCKVCTLDQMTVKSLNTGYYALTMKLGADKVAELAERAGITRLDGKPVSEIKGKLSNNLGIGQYGVSVLDQAAGFATFAAGGMHAKPHFVQKVTQGGSALLEASQQTTRAFSADVAADADYVLQHVVEKSKPLAGGRPAAGKTGTHQYLDTGKNAHAWLAGFTPQLAAAVWVGKAGADGAIVDKRGANIYGASLPGDIWRSFMDNALKGAKKEKFPKPARIGDAAAGDAQSSPEPSESPSPDETDGLLGDGTSEDGEDQDPGIRNPLLPRPRDNEDTPNQLPRHGPREQDGLSPQRP